MADNILLHGRRWRKELARLILIVTFAGVLCTGCIQQKEGSETTVAYEDYFRGDFAVTGEPILNQEVEIVFSVNPPVDSLNTEIEIFLPEGVELEQGNAYWKGDIQRDEVFEITIRVKPVQEGQWRIHIYVKGMLDGKYEKEREYYLVFLTTKDSGQVSRTSFYPPPVEREGKFMMINMILDAPPDPKVGEEIVLTFSLIASKDLSDVRAVVVLPEEFTLISGSLEWQGDLKYAEISEVIQIKIIPTERGRFWFTGTATYDSESLKYGFQMYIS